MSILDTLQLQSSLLIKPSLNLLKFVLRNPEKFGVPEVPPLEAETLRSPPRSFGNHYFIICNLIPSIVRLSIMFSNDQSYEFMFMFAMSG